MAKCFSNRAGSCTNLTLESVIKCRNGPGEIKWGTQIVVDYTDGINKSVLSLNI